MAFKIKVEPEARIDIQKAIYWYNKKQKGLGKKFLSELNENFSILKKKPYFENRYDDVHCLPLKIFPFMIHFTINNKTIVVRAVFHTSLNPKGWNKR